MKIYPKIYLLFLLCSTVQLSFGQLIITSATSPQDLVQNGLIGGGVQVSNITFTNQTTLNQVGFFTNSNTNLGLSQGILLTTGFAQDMAISGSNANPFFTSQASGCNQGLCLSGDSDLSAIIGNTTFDAASIAFDFIPEGDTIRFRYVFASEEYFDYTCSDFNDAFAFLLTGPGFSNENIALIPNTTMPVAINSVNSGTVGTNGNSLNCTPPNGSLAFSNLYIDNFGGNFVEFNGMTTVLEAVAAVTPCSTYHIKIVIADAVDQFIDSGVFLEANSFRSDVVKVSLATPFGDSTIIENCTAATLTFSLETPLNYDITVPIHLSGTALNGIDFNTLPASITIPAGQTQVVLNITPFDDGIPDDFETILIQIPVSPCSTVTFQLLVREENLLASPTVFCDTANAVSMTFGWNAVANATGYEISTNGGVTWLSPNGIQQHTVYGLSTGVSQTLHVRALGGFTVCNENPSESITCLTVNCTLSAMADSLASPTCFGGNDGKAVVMPIGGKPPYTYVIDGIGQSQNQLQGLTAGAHTVVIFDADSCTFSLDFALPEPDSIAIQLEGVSLPSCAGLSDGILTFTASQGIGDYIYELDGIVQNSGTFTNLPTGNHLVTVTDSLGCTRTLTVFLPEPLPLSTTTTFSEPTCFGFQDATVTTIPQGGTAPYQFNWNTTGQNTNQLTNLSAGLYQVNISDANGCSYFDTVVIEEPTPISVDGFIFIEPTCFGTTDGGITALASGGTGSLIYEWNGLMGHTISNIPSGNYSLNISDGNGCSLDSTVFLNQPQPILILDSVVQNVTCFDGNNGSIELMLNTNDPVTYQWQPLNQITPSINNLAAGFYTVQVTNLNNCSVQATFEVKQPTQILTLMAEEQGATCFGGNEGIASVLASGGTPNPSNTYTFQWSTLPTQTTSTAVNLVGGQTYKVSVTDANGCFTEDSLTISQPSELLLSGQVQGVSCFGADDGVITVFPSGGTPNYTFQWNLAAGQATAATVTGLGTGQYAVTVTDTLGCQSQRTFQVSQPTLLTTSRQSDAVLCFGENTGAATLLAAGGTPPYQIIWDANTGQQQSTTATGLSAGTYYATVTDRNGCTKVDSVIIGQPRNPLTATVSVTDPTCSYSRDGRIIVTAQGGSPLYEYRVNHQPFTKNNTLIGLSGGQHEIFVKDDNNCTIALTTNLNTPPTFQVNLGPDLTLNYGDSVLLLPTLQKGNEPFTYFWNPATFLSCRTCSNPFAFPIQDVFYELIVTDANGCRAEDNLAIRIKKQRTFFVATAFTPNNDGINDILWVQSDEDLTEVLSFQVFDRWGELVFQSKNHPANEPSFGWNGTFNGQMMNAGTFAWKAEVLYEDGEIIVYQGTVLLK